MEANDNYQGELTVAEVSTLWVSYQNDTMLICGLRHFLKNVDDEEIRSILEQFLAISEEHQKKITDIFNAENYPIPQGFTEQDVNLEAPRLFSDRIYLELMLNVTNFSMAIYGLASSQVERDDIIQFYLEAVDETQRMYKITKDTAKAKGFYIRYPQIPKPKQIDFVKDDSFLTGWLGEKRPLLGVEITALVLSARRNALGEALITGFSQVAETKEVRKYFEKGRDIASKHLESFSSTLNKEYIADGSRILTSEVTDSTTAPFSDKLMMFLVTTLIASSMGQYGSAMSISPRHDLGVHYAKLIAEIAKYANQGANIMIDNAWMEKPPIAADRKKNGEVGLGMSDGAKEKSRKLEVLLWSIALPGFGQLLNRKYVKGILLIFLEFLVNVQGNFNEIIIFSFQGDIELAIEQANYQWLMFYPCLYFFAMWDAFKDAGAGRTPYSFLPFAFSAYFVTVGTIFSSKLVLFGVLLGPIWLPIISVIPGLIVGFLLQILIRKKLIA